MPDRQSTPIRGWGALPNNARIRVRDFRLCIPYTPKKQHQLSAGNCQLGLVSLALVKTVPGLKLPSMQVSSDDSCGRADFEWTTLPFDFPHDRPRNNFGDYTKRNHPCTGKPRTGVIVRYNPHEVTLEVRTNCPRCWRHFAGYGNIPWPIPGQVRVALGGSTPYSHLTELLPNIVHWLNTWTPTMPKS